MQRDHEGRPAGPGHAAIEVPRRLGRGAALIALAVVLAFGGAASWAMSGASAADAPVQATSAARAGRPSTTTAGRAKPRRTKVAPAATAVKVPATKAPNTPATSTEGNGAPVRPAMTLVPVPERPRIMVLGDSITEGIGSTSRTGYRTALGARLAAAGVRYDFVGSQRSGRAAGDLDHEGHPGWRIDEITDEIDGWLASARPDVVLLDIGTNDYVQTYRTKRAPKRLARLIGAILDASPTVRVVVAKLLVCIGSDRTAGITAFNAAIPDIVVDAGPRVTVADMSGISTDDTVDGLHPNDVGYREMAALWFDALRPVLGIPD